VVRCDSLTGVRPRIGITAYWRDASFGPWTDYPACIVPQSYVRRITDAGGLPIPIPPTPEIAAAPAEVLDLLHGLVLVGGDDLDPALYGAEADVRTDPPNRLRDAAESALLRGALDRDLAILGICRGFQLLNVIYGGDLDQHIGDHLDGDLHRRRMGEWVRHEVTVVGGRLADIVPPGAMIPSHHHQGVGRLGDGLAVTAHAPDGSIEGFEDPERDFCIGVLWHPEEPGVDHGDRLFRAFVDAARLRVGA
jgi:putative glutamine amidotransferase